MNKISIRNGNRILCIATMAMVGLQYLLAFLGVYDSLALVLASQISVVGVAVAGSVMSGVNLRETYRIRSIHWRTFIFAFLMVICSYPIIALLNILSMFFVDNAVAGTATHIYQYGLGVSMLVMAVLPAIGEELLMRGVIYRSYREKSPVLAWVASAVIFGLLHMNFNQMPYAIYLGMMMVLMMEASDSIVTSMCMHFFVNGISTLSGYFSAAEMELMVQEGYSVETVLGSGSEMQLALMSMGILALIMIPLIILIIVSTFRVNGRTFGDAFGKKELEYDAYSLPEIAEEPKIVDVWLIIALLIMVVITAMNTFM